MSVIAPSIQALFRYLQPDHTCFYQASLWSILNKIFDLMPPLLVGWVTDDTWACLSQVQSECGETQIRSQVFNPEQ